MSNIVEHIKKDGDSSVAIPTKISISTIAGLTRTDALEDSTLFEISAMVGIDKYESRSVSWKTIMAKLQTTSFNNFNQQYKVIRYRDVDLSGYDDKSDTTVYKYLTETSTDYHWAKNIDPKYQLPAKENTTEPCVWGDVWTLTNGEAILSQWLKDLDDRMYDLEHTQIAFSSNMEFNTRYSVFQGETGATVAPKDVNTGSLFEAYRDSGSGINSNGFVVAFWKQSKVSSTFTCPKTGMLTLYGWLDSSNVQNIKYLPTAWCALEGQINGHWEILQIQSVIPAKQFSYVGFCVPVMKDLVIRLELGFTPGEASGRYDRDKIPESLANSQPNAFLGGVYVPSVPGRQ